MEMHFYPLLFFKGQILEQKSPIRSYTIKKYTIQSKFELLYLGSTIDRIESMRNDSFSPFPVDRRWANVGTKRRRASGAIIRLVRAAAKLRVNEPRRTRWHSAGCAIASVAQVKSAWRRWHTRAHAKRMGPRSVNVCSRLARKVDRQFIRTSVPDEFPSLF